MMLIKFFSDGESPAPGVGVFQKDEERDLPTAIAESLINYGVAEQVKAAKSKKGVNENGGD